ncbi:MAG TPA: hypothetical protein VGH76_02235 [Actinomycetospora sp.]|uniref:hypothetical protein n=1 Tax=Actinomycetospora sp. TaxID=1872135 RepID=UPI002F3FC84A
MDSRRATDHAARERKPNGRSPGHNPTGGWALSRADLAAFVVEQLDSPSWMHRTPTLAC